MTSKKMPVFAFTLADQSRVSSPPLPPQPFHPCDEASSGCEERKALHCRIQPTKFEALVFISACAIENCMPPGDDAFHILQTLSGELTALPRANAQRTEAARLIAALSDLISARELAAWLQTPNPGLDGRTPRGLIEAGELDLLWEMVHQTRYGALA